jgi:DNA repair and recombination RAD54-like protein
MTEFQEKAYKYWSKKEMSRLTSDAVDKEKGGQSSLKAITRLKKLVNHPALLCPDDFAEKWIPEDFNFKGCQPEYSGKMFLLEQFIIQMRFF